jgi:hypothetical protein
MNLFSEHFWGLSPLRDKEKLGNGNFKFIVTIAAAVDLERDFSPLLFLPFRFIFYLIRELFHGMKLNS